MTPRAKSTKHPSNAKARRWHIEHSDVSGVRAVGERFDDNRGWSKRTLSAKELCRLLNRLDVEGLL